MREDGVTGEAIEQHGWLTAGAEPSLAHAARSSGRLSLHGAARRSDLRSPAPREEQPRATSEGAPQPPAQGPFWLRALGDGRRERLRLEPGLTSLGAHAANSVVVDEPCVSRFHCRLHLRDDGRLWVRDLGSRNGTFVDGLQIAEAELLPGATLQLGERRFAVEQSEPASRGGLPGFVTRDAALTERLQLLARAAPTRIPLLLSGESGTGKEVAARAVHELSPRARAPFVAVNCGAISPELAEAELFGHERGAFTGAVGSSPGAFGAADGGTLFLDEIGDLPLALQVKLLRALEAAEVKAVGAARARSVDVRVISASHKDLRALVREGAFREDLYFRLRGLAVELTPLRERPQDILPLADHFLALESDGAPHALSSEARGVLLTHPWPGNARELRHAIRLAVALGEQRTLRARDLRLEPPRDPHQPAAQPARCGHPAHEGHSGHAGPATHSTHSTHPGHYSRSTHSTHSGPGAGSCARGDEASFAAQEQVSLRGRSLDELEAVAIRAAYLRNAGSRTAISRELGIARSSLLRKLSALGLRGGSDADAPGPATR